MFDFTGRDNDLNPGKDFNLLCPDGTRAGKTKIKAISSVEHAVFGTQNTENNLGDVHG